MRKVYRNFGFTLIELLIVIALLGVVTGVAIVTINRERNINTAKNSVVRVNLEKLVDGIGNFKISEGYYPQDANSNNSIMDESGVGTYILNWPDETPEGATYTYTYIDSPQEGYVLDATRFDTGCLSYCSIDNSIFENEVDCSSIVNSCTGATSGPPPPPPPTCGDGSCNGGESCSTCATDCGACAASCGDGSCNGGETCSSCSIDCGACPPTCGNGICSDGETCASCSLDCGACGPTCGDGICNVGESCSSCSSDCGVCAPSCGDGICSANEWCNTCSADCSSCGIITPPSLACPAGQHDIAYMNDSVVTWSSSGATMDTYLINLDKPSKIYMYGYAGEGHPEDCPSGPLCGQAQEHESFIVEVARTVGPPLPEQLGIYPDSGLNPDDGWYMLAGLPWVTSSTYAVGQAYEVRVRATYADATAINESVRYTLLFCIDD